jgi:hypothetical protein
MAQPEGSSGPESPVLKLVKPASATFSKVTVTGVVPVVVSTSLTATSEPNDAKVPLHFHSPELPARQTNPDFIST